VLVTSNRFRPPAMLAKIAATVDVVSGSRLDFGIGAGSRPANPPARREYAAHGLPFHDYAHSVGSLAEACTVIRRLWTETEPFDFDGEYVRLTGAFCSPKPVQRPHPPILIGGRSAPLLRVVAEHADLWNIPGGDIDDAVDRSALLDRSCAEIGRDPAAITRSIHLRSTTSAPATPAPRSPKRSTRASSTSSSGCRRPIPPGSRSGSPRSSSPSLPDRAARRPVASCA
jgi:alkanesulfonate monooxygenase SsuD/methylene tetrahydromethanopterin reductase-like flavin-dependent oxidoreductase (luciferase family)